MKLKCSLSGKENIFYAWIWNITRIRAKCWKTEYLITYSSILTIFEYKVNEIANKNFYIKEHHQKYNLKEIKQILIKLKIFVNL